MTTTPDCRAAEEFLTNWKSAGPWPLCAFHEERGNQAFKTFGPSTVAEMGAWIDEQSQAKRNVYFHVNTVRAPANGKALKGAVMSIDWFHVDVDPVKGKDLKAEQVRILKQLQRDDDMLPAPSVIIFSGGGYQAFWKLEEPITTDGDMAKVEDAELYCVQIQKLMMADACFNADRIMRLPGTINWPNQKKRDRGQEPVMAELVRADWNTTYPVDRFMKAPQRKTGTTTGSKNQVQVSVSGNVQRIAVDALDNDPVLSKIEERAKVAIVQGHDPDQPLSGANSRSDWTWYVACAMARANVDDDTMYSILTDPDLGISEHVLNQGNAAAVDRAAKRTIQRAREHGVEPWLEVMNSQFAAIESVGGKFRIACERYDEAKDRFEIEFHQKDGFLTMWGNKFIEIVTPSKTPGGNPTITQIPVGKWWLAHPQRREYRNVVFYPNREFSDSLNLWRGFSVNAVPGECGLFLDHVRNVLCKGNQTNYDYFVRWMANAVQNPGTAGQVAVVLRGGQGTGKGTFGKMFGKLFGAHYKYVSNSKHVTGQFNSLLTDAVLVLADECFAANDKAAESSLKALITEPHIRTEMKGVDNMEVRNCVHLIMATNADWAISADLDDRRFFVLNVADDQQTNIAYFKALHDQMEAGGYEALMHYLMSFDLSDFDVYNCPKTDELRRQQEQSMGPMQSFLLAILEDGQLVPSHSGWRQSVLKEALIDRFKAEHSGFPKNINRALGIFLKTYGIRSDTGAKPVQWTDTRGQKRTSSSRPKIWIFPPLDELRKVWIRETKSGSRDWPEVVDDTEPTEPF